MHDDADSEAESRAAASQDTSLDYGSHATMAGPAASSGRRSAASASSAGSASSGPRESASSTAQQLEGLRRSHSTGDLGPTVATEDPAPDTAQALQDSIRYATIKAEKRQLQKLLGVFEAQFEGSNGRRVAVRVVAKNSSDPADACRSSPDGGRVFSL